METTESRAPVVLVVEPDRDRAQQIYRSLRRVRIPRPYHVQSADLTREWLAECWPDLCVLADSELAASLRDDLPGVPVVVLSASDEELETPPDHPAGVDVIPAGTGAIEALAVRVRHMLMWIERQHAADGLSFQLSRTTTQLKLPYAQRLRAIGRQLDDERATAVDLLEVPGGFIARLYGDDVQTRDYREGDLPWLLEQAETARDEPEWLRYADDLRPHGHEVALRAIGQELDHLEAGAVTINDLGDRLVVRSVSLERGPHSLVLRSDDVELLLQTGTLRRPE